MTTTPDSESTGTASPALAIDGLWKRFGGVTALEDVQFRLGPGRTLGLIGENGAGKSTLVNLLGGTLLPDAGRMTLFGRPYAPRSPLDAERAGVGFIHQELNLFENLSIAENLFIEAFPKRGRWWPSIDRQAMDSRTRRVLDKVGLDVPPSRRVESLSPGERQLVEIAKALKLEARLLIFDEPTTSLSERECEALFDIIAELKGEGITMIYVSHQLAHVKRLCDEIIVLRDGALVAQGDAQTLSIDACVRAMVGRPIDRFFPDRPAGPEPSTLLEIRGLSAPGRVAGIELTLRKGEILGVGGLLGAGRTELARILFGLDGFESGTALLEGREVLGISIPERIRRGMAFLTEDRRTEGLFLAASLRDNAVVVHLRTLARSVVRLMAPSRMIEETNRLRAVVGVNRSAGNHRAVSMLSGGNQQKVVLAKWLMKRPKLLLLDEPTRGIDVGAKVEIYRLVGELAAGGTGILLISSEIEELMGICDRIAIMRRGRISAIFDGPDFDRERMLRVAIRASEGGAA